MVDAIITAIFGLQPADAKALSSSPPVGADPHSPRGVEGTLTGVRWQGQLYSATAGAHGVSWDRQTTISGASF